MVEFNATKMLTALDGDAHAEMRDVMKRNENIHDFRTAAYAVAIAKIAQSYYDLGLAEPAPASDT